MSTLFIVDASDVITRRTGLEASLWPRTRGTCYPGSSPKVVKLQVTCADLIAAILLLSAHELLAFLWTAHWPFSDIR